MNGLIYKVRDYFFGTIELSQEVNSDLIIIPKSVFENFSEILDSDNSDNSIESDSEGIFQTAFAGGIAGGFIGSYLLSEKRPYISHFVYIEQSGEVVRDFPEVLRFSDNEWRFIE